MILCKILKKWTIIQHHKNVGCDNLNAVKCIIKLLSLSYTLVLGFFCTLQLLNESPGHTWTLSIKHDMTLRNTNA